MIEINRGIVASVKIAVMRLEYENLSAKKTLVESTELLRTFYCQTKNKGYLSAAVTRIQAYLELGFCYEDNQELFDAVLHEAGTSRQLQFPKRCYCSERVPLTRSQVRQLLGRWTGSRYSTMKIQDAVDDIINKVSAEKLGKYEYHSNANPSGGGHDMVYELYIEKDDSYLYNVQTNRYYTFSKKQDE